MEKEQPLEQAHFAGIGAGIAAVTIPTAFISRAATMHPSTPEHTSAFREQAVMGISHFYDHAGNMVNGSLGVVAVGTIAGIAIDFAPAEKKTVATVGVATLGTIAAAGVNVAYEAGVYVPPFPQKPENAPFDGQDALYGSVGGALTGLVFAATTIAVFAKLKRQANQQKHRKHV